MGYSPITSLYETDMAMAFEYALDPDHSFNTEFQRALAAALSREYMDYINAQNMTFNESDVQADVDGDDLWITDDIPVTLEYNEATGEYSGTYLDLYLAKFKANLEDYLRGLDYADRHVRGEQRHPPDHRRAALV